ncbi:hypothetical protein PQG02_15525 [Nostoc sp. UHCC 0926]|nr:hypothetical protein PQG02_15525 [Nostoc sp. UHCC 0926]
MLRIGEPVRWAALPTCSRSVSLRRSNWRHWALQENNSRLMTNEQWQITI